MPLNDRDYRKAFYAAVDQRQALDTRQAAYYVPIYELPGLQHLDLVGRMRDAIEFRPAQSVQLLSGFRGSGKTSELLRLRDELSAEGYTTAYMDIGDYANTELPLDMAIFPVALAAGFATALGAVQGENPIRRLWDFLKRVRVEVESATVDFGLIESEFKGVVRDDQSFARRARDAFSQNRRAFREEFHRFFADCTEGTDVTRGVVFIVDSIDHFRGRAETFDDVRESVERAFSELSEDLCLPGVHVVYTVPVYVQAPNLEVRQDVLNVRVADKAGSPDRAGLDPLRQVLARRAPGGDLERLGPDTDRLLLHSGGLFRDLLRLTGLTLLQAKSLPASAQAMDQADALLRNDYRTVLSREQLEIMRQVQTTHDLIPSVEQWPDAMSLIASGALMRYPNGKDSWYGVHPLLQDLAR